MRLRELIVRNLRVLEDVQVAMDADLVVLAGANGSGKTSVLEAIHLLGTGRSFRSRGVQDVVRRDSDGLLVRGQLVEGAGQLTRMGVERSRRGGVRFRVDGQDVRAASTLARLLPLVLVRPDGQRLLTDGAEGRRRLLDWLMFHVEPGYHDAHLRYRRALRQRNAMLREPRASQQEREAWCAEMAQTAGVLEGLRKRCLEITLPMLEEALMGLSPLPVTLGYEPGWDTSAALQDRLLETWDRDVARGYSGLGPHRADLVLRVHGRPAQHVVSRGEGKLLVVAVQVAFARVLAERVPRRPLVLVDELASELDAESRSRFTAALADLGMQTFVTAVSAELVQTAGWERVAVLHVDQGKVSPMLQ